MTATLAHLLSQASAKYQNKAALAANWGLRDDLWSYRRLENAAHSVAGQLLDIYGLSPGDAVLIYGINSPQLVASYFGCFISGIVVVPLDQHSARDFILRVAKLTRAVALISDTDLQISELPFIDIKALFGREAIYPAVVHVPNPDDIAEIVFTSGTTGNPKGVVLTHRNIVTNVQAIEAVYPKQDGTRFLSLLPLSHMFEQTAGLFAPLSLGALIYYQNSIQPAAIMRYLVKKTIHGQIVVPQLLEMLFRNLESRIRLNHGEMKWRVGREFVRNVPFQWRRWLALQVFPELAGTPRFFICGGAALPLALELNWESLGIRVIQGYGATECAPCISVNRYDHRIKGSVGWPLSCVQLALSERNEIFVQGSNVSPGYWQNSEATHHAFTEKHEYKTGDLGEIGAQGELYIKGRSTDMIVLANGMNVFPEDIEQPLSTQEGIAGCMVMALPDSRGIPCITAILRVQKQIDPAQQEAVAGNAVRRANQVLTIHQRIGDFRIWEGDFPGTSLMKIQRWKVREKILAQHQTPHTAAPEAAIKNQSISLEQLLATLRNVPVETINDRTDLVLDLGFDSLSRVELAVKIEQQLGISCDDAELIAIDQVGELKNLISRSERAHKLVNYPTWPFSDITAKIRSVLQKTLIFPLHAMISTSFEVTGLENLQNLQFPVLFIANHASHVDTVSILRAMPATVRRQVCVAAAADYFFKNKLIANLLALAINAFPFSREGTLRNSLEYCGEVMDKGWSLLIYPEGTRSSTGELLKFKPGIGFLATGLGVPVIPIAVRGGQQILPKGAMMPKRGCVNVCFGEAINIPTAMEISEATGLLHQKLSQLLNEHL
ncbi:MAG: AMP-binding protein [Methylomicrobium sp.]|nr:AMP-binding protein [Methylomicrobium sp.]